MNFYILFEDWFGGVKNESTTAPSQGRTIEDGIYQFVSKSSGKAITIKEGASSAKGDIQMRDKNSSNIKNQLFEVKYEDDRSELDLLFSLEDEMLSLSSFLII